MVSAGLAGLLLLHPLCACRSPLWLFAGWVLLSVVVSSWQNLAWLFSWRLWLDAGSFPCLVIGTVVPGVPLLLFWAILRSTGDDGLPSSESIRLKDAPFFFFCFPGLGLRGLAFAMLACFPPGWNGGFHLWRFLGESLGRGRTFFGRWVLPDSRALGAGLPGLPGSWSLELLPPSRLGCMQLPLPLLFITPFTSLVFPSENFGVVGVDGVFGSWFWAGVPLWVVLPARCRSSASSPSNLVSCWGGGSGAWLPFFLFPFSFGVIVTPRMLERELDWDFPWSCSSFSLRGCPASALVVAGNGCRVLQARPFFRTVDLFLFETLLFPSYSTRCRYDVPGGLASGSGLPASAWGYACRRCLRIALGPGPDFQLSLFLVEGSSDGLAAGDRFVSPGRMCLTHSVHDEVSRFCAVSVWGLAFLAPLGLTVDYCQIQWRRSSRKLLWFSWGLGLPVLSLDWVLLTSSLFFPGSSHPGCHGSLSRVSTSPFWSTGWFWVLGAGIRPVGPLSSLASSHHILAFVRCELESPLFPRSLRRSLASCLAALPLPHYRWSRVHGRSSASLIWWVSALWATVSRWYRASWLAQGCVPLLRPFALLLALRSSVPSGSLLRYRSESSRWGHPSGSSSVSVLDRNEGSSSTFLVFGRSLRDEVTLTVECPQTSTGKKTLRAPSLGFGAEPSRWGHPYRVVLRISVHSIGTKAYSIHLSLLASRWCHPAGRVWFFLPLDRNEVFFG